MLGVVRGALEGLGCGNSGGGQGAGVMALNGRRSLTLTEWQSLPLVAEWQALTLFCHSFLRFAIKQSLIALPLRAKPVCHSMPSLLRFDKDQSPHQQT